MTNQDLDTLLREWPAPAPPTPETRIAARAALLDRAVVKPRFARLGMRAATVGALALAVTAGGVFVQTTKDVPGISVAAVNAQTVLKSAANAAGNRPFTAPREDQWIYIETRRTGAEQMGRGGTVTTETPLTTRVDRSWQRADGKVVALFEDGKLVQSATGGGMPPVDYATVSTLPVDPDALLAWLRERVSGEDTLFQMLASLLNNNLVPPAQEAAVYGAMAKIPGVTLNPDAVDVEGRPALALSRTIEDWVSMEILLDRDTYTYRGERTVAIADHTFPGAPSYVGKGGETTPAQPPQTIKKGAVMSLSARLTVGITDEPGQRP